MQTKDIKAVVDDAAAASDGDREQLRSIDQVLAQLVETNRQLALIVAILSQATGIPV